VEEKVALCKHETLEDLLRVWKLQISFFLLCSKHTLDKSGVDYAIKIIIETHEHVKITCLYSGKSRHKSVRCKQKRKASRKYGTKRNYYSCFKYNKQEVETKKINLQH